MTGRSSWWIFARVFAGAATALVILGRTAGAEPPAPGTPGTPGIQAAEAAEHRKRGAEHLKKEEFLQAYDEYMKALALEKTEAAMLNAASSLYKLERYDEALELYEQLLH